MEDDISPNFKYQKQDTGFSINENEGGKDGEQFRYVSNKPMNDNDISGYRPSAID